MKILNVLVACEESQRVCSEFRKLGHNAYSCDILPCSGGHPEWHFHQDVLEVIKNKGGRLETGEEIFINGKWDIMIAHPPCTYLAVSGAKWYYHPEDKDLPIEESILFSVKTLDKMRCTNLFPLVLFDVNTKRRKIIYK